MATCSGTSGILIDPSTMILTGIGSGENATVWRVVRVSDGAVMDSGTGLHASFSFVAEYGVEYQLQFCNSTLPVPTIYSWSQAPWRTESFLGGQLGIAENLKFRLAVWTGAGFTVLPSTEIELTHAQMPDIQDLPGKVTPSGAWDVATSTCTLTAEEVQLIIDNGNTWYFQRFNSATSLWETYGDIALHPEMHPIGGLNSAYALTSALQNLKFDFYSFYDSQYEISGYHGTSTIAYAWPNVGLFPYPEDKYINYAYVEGKTGQAVRIPSYFRNPCPNGYRFWGNSERYYGSYAIGESAPCGNGVSVSMGGWIRFDEAVGYGSSAMGSISCLPWNLDFMEYDSEHFKIRLYNSPMYINEYEAAIVTYGVEHLIYLTYDGTTVRLYVDNVKAYELVAEADVEGDPPRDSVFILSSFSYVPGVDHLKYTNMYFEAMYRVQRCLSEEELSELWNDGNGVASTQTLVCSTTGCLFSLTAPPADFTRLPAFWHGGYFGIDAPRTMKMFRFGRLVTDQVGFRVMHILIDHIRSTFRNPRRLDFRTINSSKIDCNQKAKLHQYWIEFPADDVDANVLELSDSHIRLSDR